MASSEKSETRGKIFTENWCKTIFPSERTSFLWTIENISYYVQNKTEPLQSSSFLVDHEKSLWFLKFYPQQEGYSKDYSRICLFLERSLDSRKFAADVKISILNNEEEKINISQRSNVFVDSREIGNYVLKKFFIGEESNKVITSDGSLRIHCEVKVIYDPQVTSGKSAILLCKPPKCDLAQSYGEFFNNPVLSDVTLRMKGEEIFAHKLILSAHSPVFSAMFKHETKENIQNLVDITDIPYETMEDVIRFIYTRNVSNLKTSARDVLVAAEKYQIEQLKAICEEELAFNLSVETAVDIFLWANRHDAKNLKICAFDFIANNLDSVRKTKEWKEAISEEPHLMEAVYFASRDGIDNFITLCDKMDIKPNECVNE